MISDDGLYIIIALLAIIVFITSIRNEVIALRVRNLELGEPPILNHRAKEWIDRYRRPNEKVSECFARLGFPAESVARIENAERLVDGIDKPLRHRDVRDSVI